MESTLRAEGAGFERNPLQTTQFQEWTKVRNVLAHRTAPPRNYTVYAGIGGPPGTKPTETSSRLPEIGTIDALTTRTRWTWLIEELIVLLEAAEKFATRMIP